MNTIKVGYLISYDYEFVKTSLPRVYPFVPEIIFAVDIDRKTWAGEHFTINDEFWEWIKEVDTDHKIRIYEDRFFIPELTAMQCDTRERNLLAAQMGACDWYIQIDSDEYFLDFEAFVNKLRIYKPEDHTTVYCHIATLFKQVSTGYLLTDESFVTLPFATNNPVFEIARSNLSANKQIYWTDLVLHQSWARSPADILWKIQNWSHKDDFNTTSFYKLWDALDEYNYHCLSNFHPLQPSVWPGLVFIQGTIPEILDSEELIKLKNPVETPGRKKSLLSRLWKEIKA